MNQFIYNTMIGPILLTEEDGYLIECSYKIPQNIVLKETPILNEAANQLTEYFDGTRTSFTIPYRLKGTEFQKKVWTALVTIPYGKTITYQELAILIGNQKACRAVGGANHNNPLAIFIPCHRVIGKKGTLVGYAGGLSIKETLLQIEKREN